jgi:glyceraldehyde-3-phosphate dehydrogenase (NADP+)
MPTLAAFQSCFPPGVVNVVSGSGREMMSPIMSSGLLDCLGFIGTNAAADALQKAHPAPHRLRVCLGLDAKNPGFVLPSANLDVAVKECVLGSLSFNGQRCTALKLLFVHESIADAFLQKFSAAVDALKLGLPWDSDTKITPLPEPEKPNYLKNVISDALAKVPDSSYFSTQNLTVDLLIAFCECRELGLSMVAVVSRIARWWRRRCCTQSRPT